MLIIIAVEGGVGSEFLGTAGQLLYSVTNANIIL
jgi:hypothetical protein